MDNRAIGIYDSGLGGLTAAKALRDLLPNENIVYFSDSGRMPYGPRSKAQLCEMAKQDMDLLAEHGLKAIIAACGTISSNAYEVIKNYPIYSIGVMEPGARAMCALPGDGPLAIIATAASIKDGGFRRAMNKISPDREIIDVPCPEFAALIEHGHTTFDDPQLHKAIVEYLAPLTEIKVDGLLLGCTHYGIIADPINTYLEGKVKLVSASASSAVEIKEYLEKNDLCGTEGRLECYTSGSTEEFADFAMKLLNLDEITVHKTPIMPTTVD